MYHIIMSYAVMASVASRSLWYHGSDTLASCYKELAAEPAVLMRPLYTQKGKKSVPRKNWIYLETNEFHYGNQQSET